MRLTLSATAACAALMGVCACGGEVRADSPLPAPSSIDSPVSAPSLIWSGASRLQILCQLDSSPANRDALERLLCARVRAIAARGAPIPVEVAAAPDPATLGGDSVVLLVHAAARDIGGRDLLVFSIRPFRQSAGDGAALFGTAPRAAPLQGSDVTGEAEAALRASLAEILPWLSGGDFARPL